MSYSSTDFTPRWVENILSKLDDIHFSLGQIPFIWRLFPHSDNCFIWNNFPHDFLARRGDETLDLHKVSEITGEDLETVMSFYEHDFEDGHDEFGDPLTTNALVSHIEWQNQIMYAMDYSESSGRSFDHVMGEVLGGIY